MRQVAPSRFEFVTAFCVDVCDSVALYEEDPDGATEQKLIFLTEVGEKISKFVTASRLGPSLGNGEGIQMWVPGDALWGVIPVDNGGPPERVLDNAWVVVCAIAAALARAQEVNDGNDLQVRGVVTIGPIEKTTMLLGCKLFTGPALNACGRYEKTVSKNEIAIIVMKSKDANIRVPEIAGSLDVNVSSLKSIVRQFGDVHTAKRGSSIYLNAVEDGGQVRPVFEPLPPPLGMKSWAFAGARFNLSENPEPMLELIYKGHLSPWKKTEFVISKYLRAVSLCDLSKRSNFQVLADAVSSYGRERCPRISFDKKGATLHFSGNQLRPRNFDNQTIEEEIIHVDQCNGVFLPTHQVSSVGLAVVIELVDAFSARCLRISLQPEVSISARSYKLAGYSNTRYPTLEIHFA